MGGLLFDRHESPLTRRYVVYYCSAVYTAGIPRVKSAKSIGVRMGNWLSLKQVQALLNAPDITTTKGLRDRAVIAVLLGCALRRSEVAGLTIGHIQQRDGRWCIVDLYGKHGRVRTIPTWCKVAIDARASLPAYLASHRTTVVARQRNYAAPPARSLSRSKYFSGTHLCRRRSGVVFNCVP